MRKYLCLIVCAKSQNGESFCVSESRKSHNLVQTRGQGDKIGFILCKAAPDCKGPSACIQISDTAMASYVFFEKTGVHTEESDWRKVASKVVDAKRLLSLGALPANHAPERTELCEVSFMLVTKPAALHSQAQSSSSTISVLNLKWHSNQLKVQPGAYHKGLASYLELASESDDPLETVKSWIEATN